jgi:hypothetical protein
MVVPVVTAMSHETNAPLPPAYKLPFIVAEELDPPAPHNLTDMLVTPEGTIQDDKPKVVNVIE